MNGYTFLINKLFITKDDTDGEKINGTSQQDEIMYKFTSMTELNVQHSNTSFICSSPCKPSRAATGMGKNMCKVVSNFVKKIFK